MYPTLCLYGARYEEWREFAEYYYDITAKGAENEINTIFGLR